MKKIFKKTLLIILSIILTVYPLPINISQAIFSNEDYPYDIKFKNIYYNIAIDEDDYLWQLGYYHNGEDYITYYVPTKIIEDTKFKKVVSSGNTYLAIDENNNLWGWGTNTWGVLRKWNHYILSYAY